MASNQRPPTALVHFCSSARISYVHNMHVVAINSPDHARPRLETVGPQSKHVRHVRSVHSVLLTSVSTTCATDLTRLDPWNTQVIDACKPLAAKVYKCLASSRKVNASYILQVAAFWGSDVQIQQALIHIVSCCLSVTAQRNSKLSQPIPHRYVMGSK